MERETLNSFLPDGVNKAESDALEATWQTLSAIDAPVPDSARMRARLDAVIDAVEHTQTASPRVWRPHVLRGLAAAAVLVIGIGIGWFAAGTADGGAPDQARPPQPDSTSEIAAMRSEMRALREMVSLSLMQQQSASERIKGVSWTGQLDRPSGEVVSALLDALMHDPNVNVRLATIDALERFASREDVRRGTIEAVRQQPSPLVQIALIDFMVKTNERESAAMLRRLAQDPQVNNAVRARAAWGLQQLG